MPFLRDLLSREHKVKLTLPLAPLTYRRYTADIVVSLLYAGGIE